MTNTEILKRLKANLANDLKALRKFAASDNMTTVNTTDGVALSIDGDVALNSSVYTTDENGNLTPAEDDDYTLDNGTIITVKNGMIASISSDPTAVADPQDASTSPETEMKKEKLADATATPAPATPATDTPSTGTSDLADTVSNLQIAVQELQTDMQQVIEILSQSTSMKDEVTNANTELEKANTALKAQVEKLSAEPAKTTVKKFALATEQSELELINKYSKKLRGYNP